MMSFKLKNENAKAEHIEHIVVVVFQLNSTFVQKKIKRTLKLSSYLNVFNLICLIQIFESIGWI